MSANISLSLPARQQGKVDSFEELIYLYTPHCLAHSGFSLGPLSPETSTLKISCSRNSRDRIFSGFEGRSFHDSNRTGSWNIRHRLLVVWSKGHHGTGLGNTRFSPASSKIKVQWKQDLNQPLAADTSGNGVAGRSENAEKKRTVRRSETNFPIGPQRRRITEWKDDRVSLARCFQNNETNRPKNVIYHSGTESTGHSCTPMSC